MSKRGWVVTAVAVVIVAALGYWLGRPGSEDGAPGILPPETEGLVPVTTETAPAELYFPGDGSRLYGESRELATGDPEIRGAALVEALLAGPRAGTSLRSPLPDGTALAGVYLLDGDVLAVDLRSETLPRPPATGSRAELLTVYSLVNTVAPGVDGVERVLLMWNGAQPETFAGQVDVSRPLRPDLSLVER